MGFLDLLVQKGILDAASANTALEESRQKGTDIEEVLRGRGIGSADILEAKGAYYGVPTRALESTKVPFEILNYIPEESARHYRFVPLAVTDGVLEIGVVDPENIEARDALQFISAKLSLPYKIFLITSHDFEKILKNYKGLSGEVTKALTELESELSEDDMTTAAVSSEDDAPTVGAKIIEDAPVTKIVATMLRYAIEGGASDIHVEPMAESVRVRFRVDGIMHTSLILPAKVQSAIVARVKVLSNMKLDEKRKPQDNRFSAHINGRKIDFRVSTFPTYYGEKVVMRILDSEKGVIPLDKMGLSDRNLGLIRKAIKKPYGLVLISGPTGSGKTTTLYSMLNEVDRETKNVLSLEDPVEYNVQGISQSQVRPEIGYTFASGLRTTLRQDPDIIMVGEIRDKETAQLAVQAALTGHLVLSTIHTNNAIGVIPRLIDMGVDPYLIAPTLVLAMAQRLVSRLCPDTGKEIPVEGAVKKMIEKQFEEVPKKYRDQLTFAHTVYEAEPSKECPSGTRGREAVFEIIEVNGDVEQVILNNPTEPALMQAARKQGMLTMKEDAILKAFKRIVPFEEVNTLGGVYDTVIDDQESGERASETSAQPKEDVNAAPEAE